MTLLIEGRTYIDAMGGTVGPMKRATTPPRNYPWYAQNNIGRYDDTGRASSPHQPCLLYELDTPTPTAEGPVRRRVVTTTEIAAGVYGRLKVAAEPNDSVLIGLIYSDGTEPDSLTRLNAEELDALAATATQLAAALRAIAAEKNA